MTIQTGVQTVPAPTIASQDPPAVNLLIAGRLRDYADLLTQQGEDGFRARAFRRAADVITALDRPVEEILSQHGREGLTALPAVGTGIASAIAEMVTTGRWSQMDRLRGDLAPEVLFRTIPGIGAKLADLLAKDGQLESLEELEHAVRFGKVAVRGIGPRRRRMIAAAIAERLGRPFFVTETTVARPPVAMLFAGGPDVSRARGGGTAAQDSAEAFQSHRRCLASHPACPPRRLAFHGPVLEHPARPPTQQNG
ncbi:hypothetical protein [Mesorhizobium sp.]|uniref:hypothetical protein n=1 Tax=Mesorhizobium sp. TaxID=1871066 RepID=UPI0025B93564|nr:hypothetical protein [Mesorhizobium sp.]